MAQAYMFACHHVRIHHMLPRMRLQSGSCSTGPERGEVENETCNNQRTPDKLTSQKPCWSSFSEIRTISFVPTLKQFHSMYTHEHKTIAVCLYHSPPLIHIHYEDFLLHLYVNVLATYHGPCVSVKVLPITLLCYDNPMYQSSEHTTIWQNIIQQICILCSPIPTTAGHLSQMYLPHTSLTVLASTCYSTQTTYPVTRQRNSDA